MNEKTYSLKATTMMGETVILKGQLKRDEVFKALALHRQAGYVTIGYAYAALETIVPVENS